NHSLRYRTATHALETEPCALHCFGVQSTANTDTPSEFWSPPVRLLVFVLAATSIWSLLVEFFGWWSMRNFTLFVSLPALAALAALALADRACGTHRLWRIVLAGASAGLSAALAYDVFRLPFVFAHTLRLDLVVPRLDLFKVFPRFGAMILSQ